MLSEESKVTNLRHLSSQHVDRRWIKIGRYSFQAL